MSPALAVEAGRLPRVGRHFRLQWEEAQGAWVMLYPEGMVKLNASAGEILRRCDGTRGVTELASELEQAFQAANLLPDVHAFLDMATKQGWVEWI